jgi:hypothetical protein
MTEGGYSFDDDAFDDGLGDASVQAMARRQFSVSLAVALAMLAAAGLAVVGERPAAPIEMVARHDVIRTEAPPVAAQPAPTEATRG